MSGYILRDIPASLWADFKAQSEQEGLPMRTVLLKLIALYTSGEVQIVAKLTREQAITINDAPKEPRTLGISQLD